MDGWVVGLFLGFCWFGLKGEGLKGVVLIVLVWGEGLCFFGVHSSDLVGVDGGGMGWVLGFE